MRTSRWVWWLAAIALAALWVVPPYAVIDDLSGGTRHASIGHAPIWMPPTTGDAHEAIVRSMGPAEAGVPENLTVFRNNVRLGLESIVVVLGALSLSWAGGRIARRRSSGAVGLQE